MNNKKEPEDFDFYRWYEESIKSEERKIVIIGVIAALVFGGFVFFMLY